MEYESIIITQKMYYNYQEKEFGIGFYPQITPLYGNIFKIINIDFQLFWQTDKILGWRQKSGSVIYGLIKKHGIELLQSLNKSANVDAQIITNAGGRIVFPISYNSTFYILENYSK